MIQRALQSIREKAEAAKDLPHSNGVAELADAVIALADLAVIALIDLTEAPKAEETEPAGDKPAQVEE